ncbi:hypothetical protein A3C86_03825 [Candidatus Kaiserbacteria bacterium RIFCSPHIGHO2_02_FULL_49_16]|uniref:NAD-dependent epimerase/dehydratase domain-containing protein n=1 Tax=Candidatus Kaiserbacteria bacterium RIFCSPHIGHO2_02_FULL_49_16 TaxID=1798490 RepID=A0A1F6D9X6_9BACT|nr:MAG: hypothetical protein A3C86_03825 [Candidatus Kaiserbacteria bacterium RIFCSPHIGHO2_02_FULL_49_16]
MRNKKIVVTGGAGFIGSHIVDELIERGADVHVVDNFAGGKRKDRINKQAKYHECDIRDQKSLSKIMRGAKYVFHKAALPRVEYTIEHPVESFEVNVQGTVAVLRAAYTAGVKRLVFASSAAVYGDQESMPLKEGVPVSPKSPYGLQKYTGELACKLWSELYKMECISLRYFNVYGSRFDPTGPYGLVVARFLTLRKDNMPLTIVGDGKNTRDYVNVRDVVRANMLAMESKKVGHGEVINIGTGREVSANQIAEMIGGPVTHVARRIEPKRACADVSKAKSLLGWEPAIALEDGILELKQSMKI